ncbi:MAG: transcription termination factor NusA [Clostridiales Family XIII bacterium]|jgi:N utilization substance protein A|nr:transcription termination factor NusA [Clostridiales Family XIII bacterium]
MDGKEIAAALDQLEREKNIPKGKLIDALERGLVSAYKGKNKCPEGTDVRAGIDAASGAIELYLFRDVADEVVDPWIEVSIDELTQGDDGATHVFFRNIVEVGENPEIEYSIGELKENDEVREWIKAETKFYTPLDFENLDLGRIAAQTAKQIVVSEVRDMERGMVYDEYIDRVGELVTGTVQRVSNDTVFVTLGKTEGLLAFGEQVKSEHYVVNSRLRYYIIDVRKSQKGPQVFLSRSHPGLVKRLFELEVPEIAEGIVTIESLAREGGSRTKMAVVSSDDSVDPVGACVGNRGVRVQAVVDELFGEKIDIIAWSDNREDNIMSALSPAKVEKIIVGEEENEVTAIVPDYQLSLAIGKEGQNVRLAAKLCGVKIDIKSHTQYYGDPQVTVNLGGELDDEGYLNPDDFMTDEETERPDAEDGEAAAGESAGEEDPVVSGESADAEGSDEPSEEAGEEDPVVADESAGEEESIGYEESADAEESDEPSEEEAGEEVEVAGEEAIEDGTEGENER